MKIIRFFLCVLYTLVLSASLLFSQENMFDNFVLTNWGMSDGLPQSTVNDIIQTQDGYIWLATFGGLVRFDGKNFTTFDRSNTEGMYSDRILKLFEDSDGGIWLGTEQGMLYYKNFEFSSFVFSDESLNLFSFDDIKEDELGNIWVVVDDRLFKWENTLFNEYDIPNDESDILSEPSFNGVLVFADKIVFEIEDDSVKKVIDLSDKIFGEIIQLVEYPENSGIIYIGTNGDGVLKYSNGSISTYTIPDFQPYDEIWNFHVDKNKRLWVTGFGGLGFIEEEQELKAYDLSIFENETQILDIEQDKEGNYWLGTSARGLYKLKNSIFTNIGINEGLLNERMLSLTRLKDDTYVFATLCGGIYEYKNGYAKASKTNEYLPNQCIWSVFQDSKDRIWLGSRSLYVTNSLDEKGVVYDKSNIFPSDEVFAITEDSKQRIWIGGVDGLYEFREDEFIQYTTEDGLSFDEVRIIQEDSDGNLWIGTTNGLNVFDDDKISNVPLTESIAEKESSQPYIRAIYEDDEGTLWFGSYGEGIFRLKDGQVSNVTVSDGLFDNIVSHLVEDEFGNFWMGSNKGISRVNIDDLNAFIDGQLNGFKTYSYDVSDGMKTSETNGGFQPSVFKNEDGTIYFPTVEGVAVLNTRIAKQNEVIPSVFIEYARNDLEELSINDEISLSYNNPFLEIGYTALSFSDPEGIQFRVKLEGLDENWIDVGNRRVSLYSRVPPGDYIFRVIASNSDGFWNDEGASLAISIVPPFWDTIWFYMLVGSSLILGFVGIYYQKTNSLRLENERRIRFSEQMLSSQENERSRIASELHDGLGQQILVIKNRIELLKQLLPANIESEEDSMHEQVEEILKSAEISISDIRNISHALRPVILEKFGLTLALTNMFDQISETSTIDWSYDIDAIDGFFPKKHEITFFRIIQEGANNILKHSNASMASVEVKKGDKSLLINIWDDGVGFDTQLTSSGLGFLGMQERIETLGGYLDLISEKGKGTNINITFKIN